jgi:hypothetical protein
MKRRDDGKVSWVEFLRSIKFRHQHVEIDADECTTHFAGINPHTRTEQNNNTEESHLIRSAN